jgi:acetylornithine deacetylase/succinyl-diaminopimelate desuccinylase-like protein
LTSFRKESYGSSASEWRSKAILGESSDDVDGTGERDGGWEEQTLPSKRGAPLDVVELTERLVAAPSPNPPGDEREVAHVVTDICAELGLPPPRVVAADPTRPNLIVELDFGSGGRHLALSGHLDTKPVGDATWSSDPFVGRTDDGHLYGLGACDMKGAVAAILLAAAELANDGCHGGRLSLVFTADEEHGSQYGSRYLAECGAVRADAIVIGEPGGIEYDWDRLHTISRGIANFSIDVYGDQGHSSLSDAKRLVSATQECARLLVRFAERFEPRFTESMPGLRPTVNAGVRIDGGVGFGVVPGKASFAVDVRLLPGMGRSELETDLERFLDEARADRHGLRCEYHFEPPPRDWLPATEVPADAPIVGAARAALEAVLGTEPPTGAFPGATDACWLQGLAGIPTLPGLGPGLLERAHAADERVSLAALRQAVDVYRHLGSHFCQSDPGEGGR